MSKQIFISYRRDGADTAARAFKERLQAAGYTVFLDVDCLGSGNFESLIHEAIRDCNDFLIFLPKDCLLRCENPSDVVREEIEWALKYEKNIIPIMMQDFVYPKKLPESIASFAKETAIPLNMVLFDGVMLKVWKRLTSRSLTMTAEAAFAVMVGTELFAKRADYHIMDTFSESLSPVFGRETLLLEIEKKLKEQSSKRRRTTGRLLHISGIAGIGKSSLALAYALRHVDEYDVIFDVHADSYRLAIKQIQIEGWDEETESKLCDGDEERLFVKLESVVRDQLTRQKGLFIVHDYNTGEDKDFSRWTELGCDVILTGWNAWKQGRVAKIQIKDDALSDKTAPGVARDIFAYYYMENAREEDDDYTLDKLDKILKREGKALDELLKKVEWHPLTMELLAKQMNYSPDAIMEPSKMLEELSTTGIKDHPYETIWFERDGESMPDNSAFGHMECIFRIVLDKKSFTDEELEALRYMTLVSSEYGICSSRFYTLTGMEPEHRILEKLRNRGLITYDASAMDYLETDSDKCNGIWRMPMLTAEVLCRQAECMPEMDNCKGFVDFVTETEFDDYKDYQTRHVAVAHMKSIVIHMKYEETAGYADMLSWCENGLFRSHESRADFALQEKLLLKAVKIRKKVLGARHLYTAASYNNLALLYKTQGKYEEAEEYYLKAIEVQVEVLGKRHPDTATSYNNLGSLYYDQRKYERAEKYYLKALEIREEVLGKRHPSTAASYNSLAVLYSNQGKYEEAEECCRKTLEIREEVLGKRHTDTATGYNNLAGLYYAQGKYEEAEVYYQKSLGIQEEVLGKRHPDTATSYNNLAELYRSQGKYEEAEEYYLKALEIQEEVLGKRHPSTATSYNNLAGLYDAQGKYEEAEEYYQKSLEIQEEVLGKRHPSTATIYNNLAVLYYNVGNLMESEALFAKALEIRECVLGVDHPYSVRTRNNLKYVHSLLKKQ